MFKFFSKIDRAELAFSNFVENALNQYPLPWRIHGDKVLTSCGRVICIAQDRAQAEAVLHLAESFDEHPLPEDREQNRVSKAPVPQFELAV